MPYINLFHFSDHYIVSVSWINSTAVSAIWMNRNQNLSVVVHCLQQNNWMCYEVCIWTFFTYNHLYSTSTNRMIMKLLHLILLSLIWQSMLCVKLMHLKSGCSFNFFNDCLFFSKSPNFFWESNFLLLLRPLLSNLARNQG